MTLTQISERASMDMESCVPPGFRFHPTEEELVGYYLKRKINSLKIDLDVIVEIDLYKIEPWDIQDRCKLGYEEQNEWYFFSHKDKKYPTGTRTNRATAAGFWKATGRDKAVMSKNRVIGMRKTLVFYKGRAPNGSKSDWIMHEYRLQTSEHAPPQEEGWVVCRAFKKPSPSHRQGFDPWCINHQQSHYFRDQQGYAIRPLSINDILNDQTQQQQHHYGDQGSTSYSTNQQQQQQHGQLFLSINSNNNNNFMDNQQLIELPQLDSPKCSHNGLIATNEEHEIRRRNNNIGTQGSIDWKSLDNLFADSAYFSHNDPNMPLMNMVVPQSHELLQPQNQASHNNVLGCFPDS